jgi:membrane protease YdiL (CAAX protease family)
MRPVRSLVIYLLAVFVGGAWLAPWLYWMTQSLAQTFPALQSLAANPFHRFVNRSLIIVAVLGLWPLLRSLEIRTWADAGLGPLRGQGRNLALGFGLGFGSLALVALVALAAGARRWNSDHTAEQFARHLLNAGLAAVLVGALEELVFRGALFGGLRRACRWPVALAWSSAVYAVVHFFHRVEWREPVDWASGFKVLAGMLGGVTQLAELVPGFLSLFLVGAMLAWGYQRTGRLYFSMGLHGGWIFWLKSYGFFTADVKNNLEWVWGSRKLIDGWLAFVMLTLTLTVILSRRLGPKVDLNQGVDDGSK